MGCESSKGQRTRPQPARRIPNATTHEEQEIRILTRQSSTETPLDLVTVYAPNVGMCVQASFLPEPPLNILQCIRDPEFIPLGVLIQAKPVLFKQQPTIAVGSEFPDAPWVFGLCVCGGFTGPESYMATSLNDEEKHLFTVCNPPRVVYVSVGCGGLLPDWLRLKHKVLPNCKGREVVIVLIDPLFSTFVNQDMDEVEIQGLIFSTPWDRHYCTSHQTPFDLPHASELLWQFSRTLRAEFPDVDMKRIAVFDSFASYCSATLVCPWLRATCVYADSWDTNVPQVYKPETFSMSPDPVLLMVGKGAVCPGGFVKLSRAHRSTTFRLTVLGYLLTPKGVRIPICESEGTTFVTASQDLYDFLLAMYCKENGKTLEVGQAELIDFAASSKAVVLRNVTRQVSLLDPLCADLVASQIEFVGLLSKVVEIIDEYDCALNGTWDTLFMGRTQDVT